MANELTLSASLKFAKSSIDVLFSKSGIQLDVTGDDYAKMTQGVGITEEALDLGHIGTPGYCIMVNNDATNFVEIRPGTGVADLITIPPGGIAIFKFSAEVTAPFVIADTAAVQIEYLLVEA